VLGGLAIQITGVTIRWCIEEGQSVVQAAVDEILVAFDHLFSAREGARRARDILRER
jgi:hypothetical protein